MATTTPALGIQNYFSTTLSAPIVATDTIIFLNTLPTPTQGFLVLNLGGANQEVIFYTSKGANYVQCTSVADGRGQDNTSAAAHSAGESVKMTVTAGYWKALQDMTGVTAGAVGAIPFATGWTTMPAVTPNTITYNGNRNYSVVFNSTDLTSYISNGVRLKLTRTVTAPTQCTSLNGTTQYYSKATPTGMTFTDDFTVSAWIKLAAYGTSMIASRYDGTSGWYLYINSSGQVTLTGNNGGAGNTSQVQSYQSIPLNKWVHVQANLDMSAFSTNTDGSATGSCIAIDGVGVPSTVSRVGTNPTALIQSGNLNIGSWQGGLSNFFSGKIAQVAIFNSKITVATMQGYISQGLAGTETSLISAYSFNNSINDLNANANNLTANGSAVATNADSPFAGGANASTAYTAGTTEFGEVFGISFSTNTTVTLQVPDGYAIPTSGGVSAMAYSTQSSPLGWPGSIVQIGYAQICSSFTTSSSSATQVLGLTISVTIPPGRKAKISTGAQSLTSGTNQFLGLQLWSGTVGSGTQLAETGGSVSSTTGIPGAVTAYDFSSGAKTYNVGFRAAAAASANVNAGAGIPAFLSIELD